MARRYKRIKRSQKKEKSFLRSLLGGVRDFCERVSKVFPPAELGVAVCDEALNLMEENTEKYEKNVRLLEQVLEIYSIQTKASVELVEGAWESVKKSLDFYTDKHQEFIKRLNQASEAIDNEYNIAPPEILKESDFESPTIVYNPKKSVYDERLKDLREDFSFSLYADLKDKINAFSKKDRAKASKERELEKNLEDLMGTSSYDKNPNDELDRMASSKEQEFEKSLEDLMPSSLGVPSYNESLTLAKKHCVKNCKKALEGFTEKIKKSPNDLNAVNEAFDNLETELERATENLSQKIVPILERYENYKWQALGYGEFLEKEKEGFIVDEQNPYPEEVRFNELRLAEFDSVFSVIVPLEDLDKTTCTHHALKALETALKNRDLGFDSTELEQIAKGFIPKGYLWHFDANVLGNVALVREELLLSVKHTKGYLLWKQFLQTQN
ncbi:HNH endonuclease [Helicobacter pylori]